MVQRALESSCSPIGIRERVVAVAVAIAVTVAVAVAIVVVIVVCSVFSRSRRVTLTRKLVFPLFTGSYNSSSGVVSKRVGARVWWKRSFGEVVDVGNWGKSSEKSARVCGSVDDRCFVLARWGPVVAAAASL